MVWGYTSIRCFNSLEKGKQKGKQKKTGSIPTNENSAGKQECGIWDECAAVGCWLMTVCNIKALDLSNGIRL